MYTLLVNNMAVFRSDNKGGISGKIAELTGDDKNNYQVLQDCTDDFPGPADHERARGLHEQIKALDKNIDFSKFDFQMDSDMLNRYERRERLMDQLTKYEVACGY